MSYLFEPGDVFLESDSANYVLLRQKVKRSDNEEVGGLVNLLNNSRIIFSQADHLIESAVLKIRQVSLNVQHGTTYFILHATKY